METIREISGNINSAVCKQIPEKGLNEAIFLCLLFQAFPLIVLFACSYSFSRQHIKEKMGIVCKFFQKLMFLKII